MSLSQQAVDELKILYLEATGKKIEEDEAWDMAHRVLRIYDLATRRTDRPGALDS